MDEIANAFELPHARASATHAGPPLDRISVRDYIRAVEIGAFRTERGVNQRIRLNVVLEVSHHAAAQDDDVDQVISYDTITEAIEAALAIERVNLLETLAERIAPGCLADRRAVRVFVRVEKLDRIPGALGVEIVRTRLPEAAPRLRTISPKRRHLSVSAPASSTLRPISPPVSMRRSGARRWRAWSHPHVLCLGPAVSLAAANTEARRRIGLLAIEQAAWAFCERDPRFGVAATRTELDWALKTGPPLGLGAVAHGDRGPQPAGARRERPGGLAGWLAEEIGAEMLVVVGAAPPSAGAAHVTSPPSRGISQLCERRPHDRRFAPHG